MLSFRQYKLLKQIDIYQKATSKIYKKGISQILYEDFFSKYTKYKLYTVNTILTELHHQKYIKDTANEIDTKIHAVTITDKGYDALDFYPMQMIFSILSFIGGTITGIIIEHFFEIINLIKTLFH